MSACRAFIVGITLRRYVFAGQIGQVWPRHSSAASIRNRVCAPSNSLHFQSIHAVGSCPWTCSRGRRRAAFGCHVGSADTDHSRCKSRGRVQRKLPARRRRGELGVGRTGSRHRQVYTAYFAGRVTFFSVFFVRVDVRCSGNSITRAALRRMCLQQ